MTETAYYVDSFTFAWAYCKLLDFFILCSVPNRCWDFTGNL